ncbi:PLP-dependent aminotransferase family protein [Paraburkholderia sp.]|uniref:aminotransferase-like domain-containing protein n=1 Tax=Paraburkholderia sp. TaxID=1926495 RepID=UPI0023867B95|nr:PLP-dependent aminotransferase family protein [Paraburkholderia sp.]MDE1184733.1 PLP-dependent aminotransferase family protein [Paraburkholderia sp.]
MKLYEKLAAEMDAQIASGVFLPGDRIPSVRQISQQHRLSIKTVLHAYLLLENKGVIQSRPKSGYFVHARPQPRRARGAKADADANVDANADPRAPTLAAQEPEPPVDVSRLVLSTLRAIQSDDAVPLGSPYPDPSLFPVKRIDGYGNAIARRQAQWGVTDELPPGDPHLIRQIARRYSENGQTVDPAEIIVTVGATEAINLCLQAVAKAGDAIAVESPTFYALLNAIERMGMRAVEIATHPDEGIDVDALARVLKRDKIAACVVMPNFQNPLGFRMSDANKQKLMKLLTKHDVPVIENDVYHELYFGDVHPRSLKSFDKNDLVLHCSSFSKSLTTGHRVGWTMPGRYREQVEKLKFLNTLTTPSRPQLAIAEYLKNERYEHHLRRIRKAYEEHADVMRTLISRYFPVGTRTSQPKGGYVLWVELPREVDSLVLYRMALDQHITIAPGYLFSTRDAYRNFIRLNYSYGCAATTENALIRLGAMVTALIANAVKTS